MGLSNKSVEQFFIQNNVFYKIINIDEEIDFNQFDILIKSPGIPFNDSLLKIIENYNIIIMSDIELFYELYPKAKFISITGTNGKTTTTLMVHNLLSHSYKCYIAGNIGIPIFDLRSTNNFENEIVIIECSSYMLACTYKFHPNIALITNILPNHLDHHLTYEHYENSKLKIIQNMNKEDLLIYSKDLENNIKLKDFNGYKIIISCNNPAIYLHNNHLYYQDKLIKEDFSNQFVGIHNYLNFQMAFYVAIYLGVSIDIIIKQFNEFQLPNYRLEKIYNTNKLIIYNDSKSTNQHALINAIETLKKDDNIIHLILGGQHRNDDWTDLKDVFKKTDVIYLFGENRFEISKTLDLINTRYYLEETLEEVIKYLPKTFNSLNIILFSPGSPSLDQYPNYIERGIAFNNLIFKYYEIGKI